MLSSFMSATEIISKVSLAGESMVGKTSLIRRYVLEQFDDKYLMTIGTEISKKSISFKEADVGDINMTFMIWDIVGLSGYHSQLHSAHFRGAKGALLVCDVTRPETLEVLGEWAQAIMKVTKDIPVVFLANKSDLKFAVQEEELAALAKKYDTKYFLTSAKTGQNVNEAFEALGRKMVSRMKESPDEKK